MSTFRGAFKRALTPLSFVLIAALCVVGVSVASAGSDSSTKRATVKVKCPNDPSKTVVCKVRGKLPKGPKGATGSQGAKGPKGPRGEKGDTGAQGQPGPAGISGYEVVTETFPNVFAPDSNTTRGLSEFKSVSCPSGKRVISGGADLGTNAAQKGEQRQMILSASVPNGAGDAWRVQLFNNSTSFGSSIDVEVYAVCANVG